MVGIAFIALGFLLVNIKKGLTIILTIIFIPLISYLLISIGINKQYITYVIIILMTISVIYIYTKLKKKWLIKFNKNGIFNLEFLIMVFIAIFGIYLIYYSSTLSTYITPKPYDFYIQDIKLAEGIPNLNDFLLYYDFLKQGGNISFKLRDDQNLNYITFSLFSFIDNSSTKVYVYDASNNQWLNNISLETQFLENPINNPEYTTLTIWNNNSLNLSDKLIVINFKSNIEPNGIFTIYHPKVRIGSSTYIINFKLGDKYACPNKCIDKDYSLNVIEDSLSSSEDIKLRINEDKDFHRFKLETINKDNIFWINFHMGFGISLFASAIVLLAQFLGKCLDKRNRKINTK